MPKARQTCTECSIRRQKCDKSTPCGRCVKRGIADRCTRHWSSNTKDSVRPRPSHQGSISQSTTALLAISSQGDGRSSPDTVGPESLLCTGAVEAFASPSLESGAMTYGHQESGYSSSMKNPTSAQRQISGVSDVSQTRLRFLQMLMPSINQVWKLVDFHEKRLLWYHGCYHGPTFNTQLKSRILEQNLEEAGVLSLTHKDLQWYSLLFAIIAGSLVCASPQLASRWGFESDEAETLLQQWHSAAVECLVLADYMSHHELYAVQSICTLGMSAHSLGHSNKQYVLLGGALRIAHSLNLHTIELEKEGINAASSLSERQAILKKEVGRRLWSQLCVQDWFSIPFAKIHSIYRGQFTTVKPANRDYLTMEKIPENEPTYVSYGNYLYEIAGLIADLHEKLQRCNTEFTKYQQVMKIDTAMRDLATKGRPRYFDVTVAIDPTWPWYISWARRSLTICFAHKIIVIHRTFLARSFEDAMFSYTRRTCIAAAKTILNEARQEQDENEPVIWIDQAFCIAASIVLALDIMHRQSDEPEVNVHRELVQQCISILQQRRSSPLASRGVRLLQSLLELSVSHSHSSSIINENQVCDAATILRRVHQGAGTSNSRLPPGTGMELLSGATTQDSISDSAIENVSMSEYRYDDFAELFPPQTGFPNALLFEELLGLD